MIFDVIVAAIIILTMVSGFRRGFIYTFSHTLGWIGAMIAAFFLASPLRTLLSEKTGLDDHIYTAFLNKFSISSDALSSSSDTFPLIMGQITETAENAAEALSERLTELTMLLLCFFLILISVKIILFFLTIGLSKRRAKGFTGFLDGLLGLLAGFLRGVVFVFLFLALLLPIVNLVSPTSTELILSGLDASYFTRTLYDSNYLVLVINDFLS